MKEYVKPSYEIETIILDDVILLSVSDKTAKLGEGDVQEIW